jgi:phage terminase large subunit-like protein
MRDHFDGAQELVVLIGKGNGKTTLFSVCALYSLLTTADARIYIAAASRDQASLMYRNAVGFIRRQPRLQEHILVREGSRELRQINGTGSLKVLASDSATVDGIAPTLFLCDELHRHKSSDLYSVAMNGLDKRGGKMVTISTAGSDLNGPLGRLRDRAHLLEDRQQDGFHLRSASSDGAFVAHEWAVPEGEDTDDVEVVKKANPSSFVTVENLRRRKDSPSTHPREWLRYACNQWVNNSDDAWIEPGKWALLGDSEMVIPEHAEVWVGVDVGLRHDTSAVVVISLGEDGRWRVISTVFQPPEGGELEIAHIENHIEGLADYYSIQGVVYDQWAFARSAQELSGRGLLMVEFPMTNARTVPASAKLLEAINRGEIVHNGDPVLQSHIESGAVRMTERGARISKDKSSGVGAGKIDALIALLLAFSVATSDQPDVSVEWI